MSRPLFPFLSGLRKREGEPPAATAASSDGASAQLHYLQQLLDGDARGDASSRKVAWRQLEQAMAFIPSGHTRLDPFLANHHSANALPGQVLHVSAFYIDRLAVTNADFAAFVAAGVYEDVGRWPREVWQHVLQFVDQTGVPGPRGWSHGRPPKDRLHHPVVGVSWFEASVFAEWVGKKLPSPAQWQRAASWHTSQDGQQTGLHYPWGNAFDARKANTYNSHHGQTVAVDQYREGGTPNGVLQLIGNVWEWTDGLLETPFDAEEPLATFAEIRGGAFDTYFESQTRCQYRSGSPLLFRGPNVGFRCSIEAHPLQDASPAIPTR